MILFLYEFNSNRVVANMRYTFTGYPENCPPEPREEMCGTYYRLVRNNNIADPSHFKSHYELNQRLDLEDSDPCSRRALSMFKEYDQAVNLSKNYPKLGKFIACLNLNGGHGVVCKDECKYVGHHNWWVPSGVVAADFCPKIEGPVS